MRPPARIAALSALLLAALAAGACDGQGSGGAPTSSRPLLDEQEKPAGRLHVHKAPHGGTLVVLADEALNLELLADPATGALTAWVLDGEAENPVRITQDAIDLTLTVGGTAQAVRLDAVANALTGETQGDTSQFAGRSDSLRGAGAFSGVVRSVTVGTRAFQSVPFHYAEAPR